MALLGAVRQVVAQQVSATDRSDSCTAALLDDVGAVAVLPDHRGDAEHLSLDPLEVFQVRRLDVRVHSSRACARADAILAASSPAAAPHPQHAALAAPSADVCARALTIAPLSAVPARPLLVKPQLLHG
jgi:hypothetical protein